MNTNSKVLRLEPTLVRIIYKQYCLLSFISAKTRFNKFKLGSINVISQQCSRNSIFLLGQLVYLSH